MKLLVQLSTKNIASWAVVLHNKGHFIPGYGSYFGSSTTIVNVGTSVNSTMVLKYNLLRTDVAFIDNENGHCDCMDGKEHPVINQCLGTTKYFN